MFQRRRKAKPLGVPRFSGTFMRNLMRGIDTGFDYLDEIEDIGPRLKAGSLREYVVHEKRFGLV